jgi:toxin ParE1/3/4
LSVPVVWLRQAEATLDAILDRIELESPSGALTMALAIRRGADVLLSDHPKAGRAGRWRGTRELVIPRTPFVVIYQVRRKPARVEILRVLHGKQKWPP